MKSEHATGLLELRRETANDAQASTATHRHKHLPALDGARGLAVMLVFLVHYGGGASSSNPLIHAVGVGVQAGWIGVTLFFILSGFLISGILWDSRGQPRYWRNFYMRRTLRIFPLYYACLLLVMLTAIIAGNAAFCLKHIYVYLFYLQNLPLPFGAAGLGTPLVLAHFWSLAVEEQFYLLWPFVLVRLKTLDQARRVALGVFLFSLAFRIFAWYFLQAPTDPANPEFHRVFHGAYGFTLSRVGELAAGCYLAMCYREPARWARLKVAAPYMFALGVGAFVIVSFYAGTPTVECAAGFMAGLPVITIGLSALLVMTLGGGVTARFFSFRPLRWLGGISYGFYIFHVLFTPLFDWVTNRLVEVLRPGAGHNFVLGLEFLVAAVLSVLFAWLSFRFYESWFLRRRTRFREA